VYIISFLSFFHSYPYPLHSLTPPPPPPPSTTLHCPSTPYLLGETRAEILAVTLSANRMAPDVNFTKIAEYLEGYTGSDIKEVCVCSVVIESGGCV
jgi:hypothetical protein